MADSPLPWPAPPPLNFSPAANAAASAATAAATAAAAAVDAYLSPPPSMHHLSPPSMHQEQSDLDAFLQRHWPQGEFKWSLAFGTAAAFLSQLSTIGKGLQKVGVQSLPELSLRPAIIIQYLSSTTWRNGLLLDILGAVFGFISLTVLPISVAQPIFCNGLVLLACYSHFYLKEHIGRREWIAVGMCFVGTILLALTLVPRDWSRTNVGWLQVRMACVVVFVFPLLITFEMGNRRAKRARGVPNRAIIELLTGMQAGVCIGVGNAALASGLQSTSKSWLDHVAKEHVGSAAWPNMSLTSGVWLHLGCAGTFVVVGAALNAIHPVFANRGYQHGRVVMISTHTGLVSMCTGVCVGIGVLDEAWPARPLMSGCRFFAFVLIFGGVLALNWQNFRRSRIESLEGTREVFIGGLPPSTHDPARTV